MKKESIGQSTSRSMTRTFLIFIFGGFILTMVVHMVNEICGIVWLDFIHFNPHRSQSNALFLIVTSPLTGLILTLYYALPILVGAVIAVFIQRIWGRVPFYSLVGILPLCVFTLYKQIPSSPVPFDYMDILWLFILQMPVVLGCWWWNNRISKR